MTTPEYGEAYWGPKHAIPLKELPVAPPPDFFRRDLHMLSKPVLSLDFDGVLHSYTSGWKGADIIPDPPVPGAMRFLAEAVEHFEVQIFSSRSGQPGGTAAMSAWITAWADKEQIPWEVSSRLGFPTEKPSAMLTIDDRALTFTGRWPSIEELKAFKPWYQRPIAEAASPEARQLNEALCSVLNVKPIHDILVEVANERRRQVVGKGFTPTHDDHHESGELTQAALWFLTAPSALGHGDRMYFWPWPMIRDADPHTPRQSLIQACALLVAEIERLDRLDVRTTEQRG